MTAALWVVEHQPKGKRRWLSMARFAFQGKREATLEMRNLDIDARPGDSFRVVKYVRAGGER